MPIIYFILSLILSITLMPISFIIGIGKEGYLNKVSEEIDVLGNVVCQDLFNATLITKDGYKFGRATEKISSVIGKNLLLGKLSKKGLFVNRILNLIQPNHSIINIQNF